MKLSIYIIAIEALIFINNFLLIGCDQKVQDNMLMKVLDDTANIVDVVSTTYSAPDMIADIETERYTFHELNEKYPVEFMKTCRNGSFYKVAYIISNGYIILYYDDTGKYSSGINMQTELYLKDFDSLNIGDALDEVLGIDENGNYSFLCAGRTDLAKVSFHYTIDGYCVLIHYDSNGVITEVERRFI